MLYLGHLWLRQRLASICFWHPSVHSSACLKLFTFYHFMPKSPNSQLYHEGFWRSVLSFSRKYWQKHFRFLFQNCCMWSHKTYQNIIGVLKLKKCCYIFEKVLAWNIIDFFSRTVACEDTKLARNVSMIGILKNFVTFLSNFISKIAALAFDWTIQFYLLQNYCMQSHKNC